MNKEKLLSLHAYLDLATQGCSDEVTEYWDCFLLLCGSREHCSKELQLALNNELDLILKDIEENYSIVEEERPALPARKYKTLVYNDV